MKAKLPALVCFVAILYCGWRIYRREAEFIESQKYKVEITVTGPDGQVIRPIARAPKQP